MKLLRKLFGGISLTAAMFVFQACYGTEPGLYYPRDKQVNFRVVDAVSGEPIPDVMVKYQPQSNSDTYEYDWNSLGYTDSNGLMSSRLMEYEGTTKFRFVDEDSVYAVKDTILSRINGFDTLKITLDRVRE